MGAGASATPRQSGEDAADQVQETPRTQQRRVLRGEVDDFLRQTVVRVASAHSLNAGAGKSRPRDVLRSGVVFMNHSSTQCLSR